MAAFTVNDVQSGIPAGQLLEREAELRVIEHALADAEQSAGGMILIEGPPGIGKSSLLKVTRELGRSRQLQVLTARGDELEREFPFGVVLQLFETHVASMPVRDRKRVLKDAASLALPLFSPALTARSAEQSDLSVLHGLYWLTANLAGHNSLLLAVDDAQWVDRPSLRFLQYVLPRLPELAVVAVVTSQPKQAHEAPELTQIRAAPQGVSLHPAPLTNGGVARLVRETLGDEAEDGFVGACASATLGNPFLLRELLGELARAGVAPVSTAAHVVTELTPDMVRNVLAARFDRMPEPCLRLAKTVAILGDSDPRRAATLAGLSALEAAEAADALVSAQILEPGQALAFVHPMVRSAVIALMTGPERGQANLRAAKVLLEDHCGPLEVASRLVLAAPGGGEWVIRALRRAAETAMAAGAPASAARYLDRCLAEHPPVAQKVHVLLELGLAEAGAGKADSVGHLREARDLVGDRQHRAEIDRTLGMLLYAQGRLREAAEEFDRGLEELGGERAKGDLAMELRALFVNAGRLDAGLITRALARLEPILQAEGHAPNAAERAALAGTGVEYVYRGDKREEARRLALRALGRGALLREETSESVSLYVATGILTWCDDYEAAIDVLTAAISDAQKRGSVLAFATASFCRSGPLFHSGHIAEAAADAHQALNARAYGWEIFSLGAAAVSAWTNMERGNLEAAERVLDLPAADIASANTVMVSFFLEARGKLCLLQGSASHALEHFLASGEASAAAMLTNPAIVAWRSGAAMALGRLGRAEEACRLADEEVAVASTFGAPRPLAAALRVRALVGTSAERLELLQKAKAILESSPARLERARVALELGRELLHRGNRTDALKWLRESFALAADCGAVALGRHAREQLVAAGVKPRRAALTGADSLTPGELRVASMAARGESNREIAQSLFVTLKGVEWHLGNAYQKLGVSSRRELAGTLTGELRSGGGDLS